MKAEKLLECPLEASYTIIARELKRKSKCCKQWYSGKTMRKRSGGRKKKNRWIGQGMGISKILHMNLAKWDTEDITFDVSLKSFI